MTDLIVPFTQTTIPALVVAAGERSSMRFLEFFTANIRNPHTRRTYYRAAQEFLAWCATVDVLSIAAIHPMHVAVWQLVTPSARNGHPLSVRNRLSRGGRPSRASKGNAPTDYAVLTFKRARRMAGESPGLSASAGRLLTA